MIRGVPRTNPPAPPPFTYNPRPPRMPSPDSLAITSPVSPVNGIPGAGPISPSFQGRGPANRSAEARRATGAPVLPPTPGSVVPTQSIQEVSDESDMDDFDFPLGGDVSDSLLMNDLSPELFDNTTGLTGDDLDTMGNMTIGSMGVDFGQHDSFNQGTATFNEPVEEVISPEVSRGESSLLPLINQRVFLTLVF